MSRWIILLLWRYSNPRMMQQMKNSTQYRNRLYLFGFLRKLWCWCGVLGPHLTVSLALSKEYPGLGKRNACWRWMGNSGLQGDFFRSLHFEHFSSSWPCVTIKWLQWFQHFLHGVLVSGLHVLDLPHLAEAPLANDVLVVERFLSDLRTCSLGVLAFLSAFDDGLTGWLCC